MRPGTVDYLVGAAFAVLLALAITTVALGVITALKVHHKPADDEPDRRIPR
ncbi:hypothetical protein ACWC5I_06815 [Kitasatospora sp. NPDC001574]